MNIVTPAPPTLRRLAPAVVVPPGTWDSHTPPYMPYTPYMPHLPHAPLKTPFVVPEGDDSDRPCLPLQCGAATPGAPGAQRNPRGRNEGSGGRH
ncbi:hypothetical protein PNO31109_00882 [Pandoraea nosoerga]|uniref:Uncharacterized protein n=1 Tax=Pandoraea nosoerga TaxID=2508296 RepID=A0A5E4SST5_9BURK|nr:hypothetical protein PNO31109_00882 [Pandoraea nosoerga]